MNILKTVLIAAAALGLAACSENADTQASTTQASNSASIDPASISLEPKPGTGRWYSQDEVVRGKEIFATNCASCHGQNAEATPNWKTLDANGNYPPPPLNGTAHAWHHPLSVLKMVIEEGGEPVGGVMPAWGDTLSDQQIMEVIASFQSYWPDTVYGQWLVREQSNRGN